MKYKIKTNFEIEPTTEGYEEEKSDKNNMTKRSPIYLKIHTYWEMLGSLPMAHECEIIKGFSV